MTLSLWASALVLLALASVLWPWWRSRNDGAVATDGRRTAVGLVLALPLVTFGLYQMLGAPGALGSQDLLQARSQHDVDAMLDALQARVKTHPDDAEALFTLGRAHFALQNLPQALETLARARSLAPKEARMHSHYAEALAMSNPGALQGEVRQILEDALELDPDDDKALELAGLAAFQREEWAVAAMYWRRLQKRLPAESEFHQDIGRAASEAEQKAALASGMAPRLLQAAPAPKPNPHR